MRIQDIIDESLTPKEKWKRSGKWSPSSFGKCLRNQYWNRKDEPKTEVTSPITLRRFKCGNLFEKWVCDLLPETIQRQVLCEEPDVKGYADLVDADTVYDIKSKQSKSFWYDAQDIKGGKNPADMFINYWLQLSFYAVHLKKPFIRLVFVSKDDLTIAEYTQEVKPYWESKLQEELQKLNFYWGMELLPPAEPRLYTGKKECSYCDWRTLCKTTENNAKAAQ